LNPLQIGWAGTSFTSSNPGYSYVVDQYLRSNFLAQEITPNHAAIGGHNTWSNLVRLASGGISNNPQLLVLDTVNDAAGNHCGKSLEALIRRVWAANPNTRIILMRFATYGNRDVNANVNFPVNAAALVEFDAIAAAYGLTVVDWHGRIQQLVNSEGHNLNEYISEEGVSDVHPNTTGYALAATLLQAVLPGGGTSKPLNLPVRIYDNGDYENTPIKINGTAYNARSGTWADSGGQVSSSTVGSTITYIATCQSFGCYRVDGLTNDVTVSIDGGAFVSMVFYQNGVEIAGGRAAHTIVIKVNSGTVKIDEFWAV